MTGEAADTRPEVDAEAATALAMEIAHAIARHYQRRPADHAATFEALNALALVGAHVIGAFDDATGQDFFEACLLAQISDRIAARAGLGEPSAGSPGGPVGAG
jgi:hypothetical protein